MRLWKRELQVLSSELGIDIRVHHLPGLFNALGSLLLSPIRNTCEAK